MKPRLTPLEQFHRDQRRARFWGLLLFTALALTFLLGPFLLWFVWGRWTAWFDSDF